MLQQQQGQTADCDSDPENEADQIRVKELRAIDDGADYEQHRQHHAHDQRADADAAEFDWWCVTEWLHIVAILNGMPQRHGAKLIN